MITRSLSALFILLAITACNGTFELGLENTPPSPIAASTVSPVPSGTPNLIAASTVSPVPTDTPIPPAPTALPPSPPSQMPTKVRAPTAQAAPQMVQIFLIALEDHGQTGVSVGCGDSAVPVQVQIPPTRGVLKAALTALLAIKDQYYGQSGLYNALYQSELQVQSVSIDGSKASIYLTGTLLMGGECDTPRVQAQLTQTALQFPNVTEVAIFINGTPLAEVQSLKGSE